MDLLIGTIIGGFVGWFGGFLYGWMNAFDSGDANAAMKYMFRPFHNLRFPRKP